MPAAGLASLAAPLIVIEMLLLLRIGVAAGGWLASRPALRGWVRVLGILLLLGGAGTVAVALLPRAPGRFWVPLAHAVQPLHIEGVADAISGSPLASLWGAPLQLVTRSGNPELAMLIGAEAIVLLAVIWRVIVAMTLRPSRRLRLDRVHRVPGVFRWLPATPAGAVTARSFLYWVRDPRYRVVFGILPVLPAITLLAFWVGGVPPSIGAFVPLGLMVLVLAWSTIHNDVAYDSTAIWTHVVAHTRGLHDRLGRVWPVLVFGTALIAVGTPISVWAQGELTSLPAMLGIDIALLLGGIGVGSAMSSRYPYPAPRPGDDGFTYPQASGSTGVGAQAGSFLLTVLVALLPITATALWLLGWSGFNWVALGTGVATGGLALALGVVSGGRVFDRRGPELLAFTMQN
jgi:ABC-2 type transport system permease protein